MRMMWMLFFMLLPLVGIAYVAWHVWILVPLPAWVRVGLIALGVGAFLLMMPTLSRAIDQLPLPLARTVYDVGCSSVIVLLYLVIVFLVLDAGRLFHLVPASWLYRNFVTTAVLTIGIFTLFLYGNIVYNNKVREELHLTTAKPLARPLKLVLMSDLHLGYHNPRKELARWVDMVNAEHPDMVLIAGDIIDLSIRPLLEENMAEELRRMEAPVYACLGNHEYYSNEPRAEQFYRDANIHLLRDTAVWVYSLLIIGRDDRTNRRRKPLAQLVKDVCTMPAETPAHRSQDPFTILLDHQPYELEKSEQVGIDFQFSGHTHHGQVWPISWITNAVYECSFGEHQRGATRYYVSSGLGIWGGKFRIGTRSEYVVATIEHRPHGTPQ